MKPLWWLLSAKEYKDRIHKQNTAQVKAEFEKTVTQALGGKY